MNREDALQKIRSNIKRSRYHVYQVIGGPLPQYTYTIGMFDSGLPEIILAGASYYTNEEALKIVKGVASQLLSSREPLSAPQVRLEGHGAFALRKVDESWSSQLMLGALDYYALASISALQVVPGPNRWTVDVPNMEILRENAAEPIWRWLTEPWRYGIPEDSEAATNLAALRGDAITEAARWEEKQWELSAGYGPDVAEDDVRWVPIGVLLGADDTLDPVASLGIGEGLWRDGREDTWHEWKRSS